MSIFTTIRIYAAIGAAVVAAFLSSCNDSGTEHSVTTTQTNVIPGDSGSGKVYPSASAPASANMAITLPVLDALFYEEGFTEELKTRLGITDAQIQKLKAVSQEAVADLTEDGLSDYTGSSRTAITRSEEQLKTILGEEKAKQLAQLVNERYANGDVDGLLSTTPNAIPSDTRIVVNAPGYRMDVFQDGSLVKTYRVGIGYPEFPLPTGMRRAETIIFNPTWTPPDEPWVKGKFKPGQKVEAGSKLNPLGPLKIPIGLPSLIHGGKQVARLGTFASHGCVGLTNDQVQDFAVQLSRLSGSALTIDEVLEYAKKNTQTQTVRLSKPIPIELRYETIVATGDSLHIYRDVYERGTNTVDNARRVLEVYGISYESLPPAEKQALVAALSEMNRDPQGKAIVDDVQSASANFDSGSVDGVPASKLANSRNGKETRTIVGKKEATVFIGALRGKGYPAPVAYDNGIKPKPESGKGKSTAKK